MKKFLLAAIVIFFLAFTIFLVMSDISNSNNPNIDQQYYASGD